MDFGSGKGEAKKKVCGRCSQRPPSSLVAEIGNRKGRKNNVVKMRRNCGLISYPTESRHRRGNILLFPSSNSSSRGKLVGQVISCRIVDKDLGLMK